MSSESTASTPDFIHLRIHSEYSLEDGIVRIKDLASACAKQDHPAAAITDVSNFFSIIKLYRNFHQSALKPIIGADLWVQYSDDPADKEKVVFLAENNQGYIHISELISQAYTQNHQGDYVAVMFDWIAAKSQGVFVLSGGPKTLLGDCLIRQNIPAAAARARKWQNIFGSYYFLELQRLGHSYEKAYNSAAIQLAAELQIPVVATNDVRFIHKQDFDAHEVRYCVNNGYQLNPEGNLTRPKPYTEEQYFKTATEMAELFADIPQALQNSVEIAKRCNVTIELDKPVLPAFDVPFEGMSESDYLRKLSHDGLLERLEKLYPDSNEREQRRPEYVERLDLELGTIIQMGFPGYFLIVADFIQWSKEQDIPVGPGRGSGAGSLVAYALKITDLDPLPYDLLFERFLNPERVSMPDFDIDFCMDRRDNVISYVAQKYGKHRVSQIATHGSMMARAVVRDVGRVMGYSYGAVDRVAKLIPSKPGTKLNTVMLGKDSSVEKLAKDYEELHGSFGDIMDELHDRYQRDEDDIRQLIDMALRLEGIARNVGKHAGGVVIAPTALTDFSPLYCDQGDQGVITQYDKDDVEAAGLVKFDFLGLRTLTIIDWAVEAINQRRASNNEDALDITLLPLDDPRPFQLLQKAQTTAVFQLESPGMKRLISRLKPENFEEIIALVALYRPGPLDSGMTDDFINRKHGAAKVEYLHESLTEMLKPILEPTYGVIVYQEQVMQIAQAMGNFSLGGADLLRRAMGKKKVEEMEKQKSLFVDGSLENDIPKEISTFVFDSIEKFAGYGFNKSHSAGYALLAYQTAWLKAYYPAEFMAAVLSSDMDKTDKVVTFIDECRALKIEVVPPNVNLCFHKFVARDDRILFGLGAIKGVGEHVISTVVNEREANGPFADIFELCRRLPLGTLNKKSFEAMTYSGALDDLGPSRSAIYDALPEAIKLADQYHKDENSGQGGLFGDEVIAAVASPSLSADLPEWPSKEKLDKEKNALGLFISGHPINDYQAILEKITLSKLGDLATLLDDESQKNKLRYDKRSVTLAGYIMNAFSRPTKRGGNMTIFQIDDRTGQTELRLFDEELAALSFEMETGKVVIIEADMDYDSYRQDLRYKIKNILTVEDAQAKFCRAIRIALNGRTNPESIQKIRTILERYQGGHAGVLLQYQREDAIAQFRLGRDWIINPTPDCLAELNAIVGEQQLTISYRTSLA